MLFKVSAVAAATSAVILSTVSADPSIGVTETALVNEEAVESAASASFADSYVPHKMLKAAKKEEERVQSAVLRNGEDNYSKEAPLENEEELLENDPSKFFGILDHAEDVVEEVPSSNMWDHRNLQYDNDGLTNCVKCPERCEKVNQVNGIPEKGTQCPRPKYGQLYFTLTECYGRNTSDGEVDPYGAKGECKKSRKDDYGVNYYGIPINCWDVSRIERFDFTFYGLTFFNRPLNCWDTSKGTSMKEMFTGTLNFEQDIGDWETGSVRNMYSMFYSATAFQGRNIRKWDTSKVTDMSNMFSYARRFNNTIATWDTSKVTAMDEMFLDARRFNKPLNWDVSSVQSMRETFFQAYAFNQKSVNDWNTASLTDTSSMFHSAKLFNQDLNNFGVSKVTSMEYMFYNTKRFDKPLDDWDVSNVVNMKSMFEKAKNFNQDISNWNVEKVVNFTSMFDGNKVFDQPIGDWNPTNAQDMDFMFTNATKFNQCLDNWASTTPSDVQVTDMFEDSSCTDTSDPDPNDGPWCQTQVDGCGATPSPTKAPTTLPPTRSPNSPPTPTEEPSKVVIPFVNRDGDGNPICEDLPVNVRFNVIFGEDDRDRPDKPDDCDSEEDADPACADPDDKKRQNCASVEGLKIRVKERWCNSDARIRGIPTAYEEDLPNGSYVKLYNLCPKSCKACADTCTDSRQAFTVTTDESKTNRRCTYLDKQKEATAARLCRNKEIELKRGRVEFRIKPLMEQCPRTCGKLGSGKCAAFLEDSSDSGDERRI